MTVFLRPLKGFDIAFELIEEIAKNKSFFEMTYATIIELDEAIKDKKELERIILCDAQLKIYPKLEKCFLDLLHNSGYPNVKFEKKIDFENLYNQKFN